MIASPVRKDEEAMATSESGPEPRRSEETLSVCRMMARRDDEKVASLPGHRSCGGTFRRRLRFASLRVKASVRLAPLYDRGRQPGSNVPSASSALLGDAAVPQQVLFPPKGALAGAEGGPGERAPADAGV